MKIGIKDYIALPRTSYLLKDAFIGYVIGVVSDNNHKEYRLNQDALKIIKKLTGEINLEEIVNELEKESYNPNNIANKVMLFLEYLSTLLELQISKTPMNYFLPIIGDLINNSPRHFSVELTNKCNIKCRFCYNDSNSDNYSFLKNPLELFHELKNNKVQVIELTGGEPFLHPEFLKIIDYCAKNFLITSVITNGTHLPEEFFRIAHDKNIIVQVTLPGSTKDAACGEYIGTSNRDSIKIFDKKIAFIKKMAEYKLKFRIVMIVDDRTKIPDVENTIKLAKSYNAMSFSFTLAVPSGRALHSSNMDTKDIEKFYYLNQDMLTKYKGFVSNEVDYNAVPDLNKGWNCGAGHRSGSITAKNQIKPCVMFIDSKSYDKLDMDNISESINNRKYVSEYSSIIVPSFSTCKNCEYVNYCLGCLARGISKIKDIGTKNCKWYDVLSDNEKKMITEMM